MSSALQRLTGRQSARYQGYFAPPPADLNAIAPGRECRRWTRHLFQLYPNIDRDDIEAVQGAFELRRGDRQPFAADFDNERALRAVPRLDTRTLNRHNELVAIDPIGAIVG